MPNEGMGTIQLSTMRRIGCGARACVSVSSCAQGIAILAACQLWSVHFVNQSHANLNCVIKAAIAHEHLGTYRHHPTNREPAELVQDRANWPSVVRLPCHLQSTLTDGFP